MSHSKQQDGVRFLSMLLLTIAFAGCEKEKIIDPRDLIAGPYCVTCTTTKQNDRCEITEMTIEEKKVWVTKCGDFPACIQVDGDWKSGYNSESGAFSHSFASQRTKYYGRFSEDHQTIYVESSHSYFCSRSETICEGNRCN